MQKRGRPSAADQAAADNVVNLHSPPPEPPEELTEAQAKIWREVVDSRGGDLIAPEAFPVLAAYCRAVVAADQIAYQLSAFDLCDLTSYNDVRIWDKLHAMQDRALRLVASLGGKLRLTPASRVHRESAGRNAAKGEKKRPWDHGN
jgi:phage terminase small subunit